MGIALDAKAPPAKTPPAFAAAVAEASIQRQTDRETNTPAPLASLAAVPAFATTIQRKCDACNSEDQAALPVQPKLEVGAVDDKYEREADDIAGKVMAMRDTDLAASVARGSVQRACSACNASNDNDVRARRSGLAALKALTSEESSVRMKKSSPAGVESEYITASDTQLTSGGAPLPTSTRDYFESRMGRDLSNVRVHQGSDSDGLNSSISARAFTYQNHVWLGAGESASPSFTMAHELAHVMQQTAPGPVGPYQNVQAKRADTQASIAPSKLQRFVAFWQPLGSQAAQLIPGGRTATGRHNQHHSDVQAALVNANSGLVTEVRIPNAGTTSGCGYADLYKSNNGNVPGLEPDGSGGLRNLTTSPLAGSSATSCLSTWSFHPMLPRVGAGSAGYHHSHRYPRINSAGTMTHLGRAPTDIWIGDVKPGHNERARQDGQTQVDQYIDGVRTTAAMTGGAWNVNARVLRGNQVNIPRNLAPNRRGGWNIPRLELRLSSGLSIGSDVFAPQAGPRGGSHRIRGRLSAIKDRRYRHGIWVYFIEPRPGDLARQFDRRGQNPNFRRTAIRLRTVLNCLKSSPNKRRSLCRRPLKTVNRLHRTVTPVAGNAAPRKVRRRVVNDTSFKFAKWNAMRVGSNNPQYAQFNRNNVRDILEQEAPRRVRQQLKFQKAAVDADAFYDDNYGSSNHTANVPRSARVAGPNGIVANARKVEKYEFWTNPSAVAPATVFGRMRQVFGNIFVRALAGFENLKTKAKRAFRSSSFRGGGGSALAAVARKVAGTVLTTVGAIMMRKVGQVISKCLEDGFTNYMTKMIEGDSLEALLGKFQSAQSAASQLRDDVLNNFEDIADRVISPMRDWLHQIGGTISVVSRVIGVATKLAHALRVGACLSGLSAAGVGAIVTCLASALDLVASIFGRSPIDWVAGRMMESCASRKLIAKALMASSLVKHLPTRIAQELIKKIRDELPEEARDIFCDPDEIRVDELTIDDYECYEGGSGSADDQGGGGNASQSNQTQTGESQTENADADRNASVEGAEVGDPGNGSTTEEVVGGSSSRRQSTVTTVTSQGNVVGGDPSTGNGFIESGINVNGEYSDTRVTVRLTINIGREIFRNQPAVIVVRSLRDGPNGSKFARFYFPEDAEIRFCNEYAEGACSDPSKGRYYEWSPDVGTENTAEFQIRGAGR